MIICILIEVFLLKFHNYIRNAGFNGTMVSMQLLHIGNGDSCLSCPWQKGGIVKKCACCSETIHYHKELIKILHEVQSVVLCG